MGKITPAPEREFADDLKGERPGRSRPNNPSGRERRAAEAAARARASRRRGLITVGASALVILAIAAVVAFVVMGRVRSTQSAEAVAQILSARVRPTLPGRAGCGSISRAAVSDWLAGRRVRA